MASVDVHSDGTQEPPGCSQGCPRSKLQPCTQTSSPKYAAWQCGWAEGSLLEHVTQGTVVKEGKIFGTAAEITTCISMEITREFEQGAEEQ